jgi:hypothetical protein
MEAVLNVVENAAGNCTKADDAEQYVIDELRKMGNDALHCWADTAVDKAVEQTREQQPELHGNGKKKSAGTRPLEKYRSLSLYIAVLANSLGLLSRRQVSPRVVAQCRCNEQ